MKRQKNTPNYTAYVMAFVKGEPHTLCDFKIEQVMKTDRASLERTNRQVVEEVEGHRDRTGLEYRVCLPTDHLRPHWANGTRRVDIG